jgi:hypothetical protein
MRYEHINVVEKMVRGAPMSQSRPNPTSGQPTLGQPLDWLEVGRLKGHSVVEYSGPVGG